MGVVAGSDNYDRAEDEEDGEEGAQDAGGTAGGVEEAATWWCGVNAGDQAGLGRGWVVWVHAWI